MTKTRETLPKGRELRPVFDAIRKPTAPPGHPPNMPSGAPTKLPTASAASCPTSKATRGSGFCAASSGGGTRACVRGSSASAHSCRAPNSPGSRRRRWRSGRRPRPAHRAGAAGAPGGAGLRGVGAQRRLPRRRTLLDAHRTDHPADEDADGEPPRLLRHFGRRPAAGLAPRDSRQRLSAPAKFFASISRRFVINIRPVSRIP